jgi:hypothetical protein
MTAARPYRLELYWDDTGEPLLADAARIASFVEELRTALPAADRWDIAEGDALYPLDVERPVEPLLAALERARESWVYFSRELSAHSLLLKGSRPRPKSFQLEIKCKCPNSDFGIWFPNRAVLGFFAPQAGSEEPAQLWALMDSACRIFQPAWACLGPPDWPVMDMNEQLVGVPKVSWATYFSPEYTLGAAPSPAASVQEVSDTGGGQRVVAVPDWFDVNDEDHRSAVESVERDLAVRGVLRPRTRLASG